MSSTNLEEYTTLFITTAKEHIESSLDIATHSPLTEENLSEIYRHIHSLKGSSSVMDVQEITNMCEQILILLKDETVQREKETLVPLIEQLASQLELYANKSKNSSVS